MIRLQNPTAHYANAAQAQAIADALNADDTIWTYRVQPVGADRYMVACYDEDGELLGGMPYMTVAA